VLFACLLPGERFSLAQGVGTPPVFVGIYLARKV
jgi:hypothetical protein